MAGTQVRLDGDVAAELQRRADPHTGSGRSLSGEANVWLRRALGLAPGVQSPAAQAHPAPASIGAAKLPGAAGKPLPRDPGVRGTGW